MASAMTATSPDLAARLRSAGLRPTRQRLALARVLFEGGHRHLTAESLHSEVKATPTPVSLATVYNALNQFRDAGLLREVVVAAGRSYFDTNTGHHHHFYVESDGELHDFPSDRVTIAGLPAPPKGTRLSRVDVIVRVRR
jgi:Fur family iron response transcriptional regulator